MSAPTAELPISTTLDLPLEEEREATIWSSVTISLDKIIDDNFNPRKDFGEHDGTFASLVASIRERGMLQPPLVRPVSSDAETSYHIVMGHRRIAAARALGWDTVRCTPVEDSVGSPADYTDSERLIDALVENVQRKDLNCIELAEGIAELEKRGKTQSDIARWINRDQGRVSRLVRLLQLPDGVRTLLRTGELSQSHGEELLPLLSESFLPGEIESLADKATEGGLTASGLRNVVREKIERGKPKTEVLTFDEQTTLEEVEDYAAPHNLTAPVMDDERIARTLASTKGMDKEPKPLPREDNGLTRKDADAQFAAAMAPDPDVVPLSERPSGDKPKGTFFFLPADAAQLLFELSDWHRQEHDDLITADQKLADIVRSFHAAKLEMRAEAEAAKAALAATLPVFEVPEVQEPRKYDHAVEAAWRVMRTGILDRFCALERVEMSEIETLAQINTNAHDYPKPEAYLLEKFELQESALRGDAPQWGKICRFKVMISGVEHRIDYVPGNYFDNVEFHCPADTGISESGYRSCSARHTEYTKHASPLEWVVATGEAFYAERFKPKKSRKKKDEEEPIPAPTDLYDTPQGIADGLDEFAGRLV